ncbi:Deoxyuridine 5'-triphosphate nucleotidohydrolase [Agrobacterium sp. DSM 25558]|nr:dUTP diphosphatase [Agrobacterium sp. DSM 25558]SCX21319.1 Deoxyuridine 5'-triphosphate nucleotidohydrolase [Agrobacterium sp. DSM 25558]
MNDNPAVRVVLLTEQATPPEYKTSGSAGADLFAAFDSPAIVLGPGQRANIPTGICIEIPEFMEAQVRPRSGLASHHGVTVLNSPGTIDSDYRGEVSRVLTTNFDTLFERAAKDRKEEWRSVAVKGLPKPGGPRDYGIHHLHGRIADSVLELPETELILTSADFGDAYLRDGWASRYVEDRMRTATLVLVGYRAEDAALRLLLETLDVDRERFPDLKKVYALERGTPGSAAQWRAKGVTAFPIARQCKHCFMVREAK